MTIQALGWRSEPRYLPLQDDIAWVAYWYQNLPTAPFPPLIPGSSFRKSERAAVSRIISSLPDLRFAREE